MTERLSEKVMIEYLKVADWADRQAALRSPVGDTMHGLSAEAIRALVAEVRELRAHQASGHHSECDPDPKHPGYFYCVAQCPATFRNQYEALDDECDELRATVERERALHAKRDDLALDG